MTQEELFGTPPARQPMQPSIPLETLKECGLRGIHPAAEAFPLMTAAEFDELCASIKESGLQIAICVNPEGLLLDGRNRLLAAIKVGAWCPKMEIETEDEVGFIVAMNLKRRHLTYEQRVAIGEQLATMRHGGDRKSDQKTNLSLGWAATRVKVSATAMKNLRMLRKRRDEA
jgi:hypothetical protein